MHLQWRMRHCQTELARWTCEPVYWKLSLLHGFYWPEETGSAFSHGWVLVQQFLHSPLQKTPFEALYGYPQPQISEFSMVGTTDSEAQTTTVVVNTEAQSPNCPAAHEEICRSQASGKDSCSRWHVLLEVHTVWMLSSFALTSSCKVSFVDHFGYCITWAMWHITCSCKRGHPPSVRYQPAEETHRTQCSSLCWFTSRWSWRAYQNWTYYHTSDPKDSSQQSVGCPMACTMENFPLDVATWEDANFMKRTFPAFSKTVKAWRRQPSASWGQVMLARGYSPAELSRCSSLKLTVRVQIMNGCRLGIDDGEEDRKACIRSLSTLAYLLFAVAFLTSLFSPCKPRL